MISEAELSPCGLYRYTLTRIWGDPESPHLLPYIALNPSTAKADLEDNTSRRYMGFAQGWAYHGYIAANVYGLRSTDPRGLWKSDDPVGPDNDRFLLMLALRYGMVVCAWGVHAKPERVARVMRILKATGTRLMCLGVTKDGHPRHPLMVRGDQPLVEYRT